MGRRGASLPFSINQPAAPALTGATGEGLDAGGAALSPSETEFLRRLGIPEADLAAASANAVRHGTTVLPEIFALGFARRSYWSMLAGDLGLPFVDDLGQAALLADPGMLAVDAVRLATAILVRAGGETLLVTAPGENEIALLRGRLASNPALAARIRIAAPETIRGFIASQRRAALSHYALNRLAGVLPRFSAGRHLPSSVERGTLLVAAVLALALVAPLMMVTALGFGLTLFFVNCSLWKLAVALRPLRQLRLEPRFDDRLPSYGILVPLYREAAILPDIVKHLGRLDYPRSKLQILLILEADDLETKAAAMRHAREPGMEVVEVPPGGPRTKPKALTYALPFVRTDYVVVYDAEDRPDPRQLRKAIAAFRERPALGCVQARLAPDNRDSWLARMFAVEYAANFEVVLPAPAEWRVPIPLGGTSNHFPRAVLEKVAAWDPYNVTEDADLGIRLARFGFETATILSRTYEEAPVRLRQWLPQRRRWIKGWMQTVILCMGRAISPGLKLPLRQRLAVHGVLTAGVLGLLLYPISLWVIATAAVAALSGKWPASVPAQALLALNFFNLTAVFASALVTALRGLTASRAARLIWHIPALPFYWALMSFAAWQALFQFFRSPTLWEKTAHGIGRRQGRMRGNH